MHNLRPARWLLLIVGLLALALPGCSGGKSSASGKVTYNGRPVKNGSLVFSGPDGVAVIATIDGDGNYRVDGVGAGTVKVGVSSASAGAGARAAGGRAPVGPRGGGAPAAGTAPKDPDWFPIPDQLGSPETSGFTVQFKSGSNSVNLEFK